MRSLPNRQSTCLFGVARADITPPVGIYHRMWGAATHDRSEGVHRPLTATAMYFESLAEEGGDQGRQLLLAIDHCLLGPAEVEAMLAAAARRASLPVDAVSVTFSHTHAAGLLNLDRAELPGGELIPDYLARLNQIVAQLAETARATAVPADIVYGRGACSLAAQRDFYDTEWSRYVCGFNPGAAADQMLLAARITDDKGGLLATIVNYACHPTTLAWDNRLISPDFVGALRETVETALGGVCVFLQGASGDLGPVEGFVGDVAVADRNGRQLGFAALEALTALPPPNTSYDYQGAVVSGTAIGVWGRHDAPAARRHQMRRWACQRSPVALPYRADLPRLASVRRRRDELITEEDQARRANDPGRAAELRALVERETRMLGRLRVLPAGDDFPLHAAAWRIGDAVWLSVQGEPYSLLQQRLRALFPDNPIVIATIANGWGPSYLPPQDVYGKGVYQEQIAALAPGSLEQLIDALAQRIAALLSDDRSSFSGAP